MIRFSALGVQFVIPVIALCMPVLARLLGLRAMIAPTVFALTLHELAHLICADWLREKAITVAEEMLQVNDEIDLFFALNDPMAEGAYIAAKNAGREKDMYFIGVDGLPTPDGGIRSVMDGRLSLSMVYPTGGKEAIESAYKLLVLGEELEKNVTLGTEVITPDNAAELLVKYGGSVE